MLILHINVVQALTHNNQFDIGVKTQHAAVLLNDFIDIQDWKSVDYSSAMDTYI